MKRPVLALLPLLLQGDAGVLIPADTNRQDPARLALVDMQIHARLDNGSARVRIQQIFANRTPGVLEGVYHFALPGRALISDFAVWDGLTRIPGVILERRRAEEIYNEARAQVIDPGLLQQGEHGEEEARRTSVFTARVVPIPAFGTKRIEIEYEERLPVEQMQSFFAIPLRPDAYRAMTAGQLSIAVEIASQHPLANVEVTSKAYPLGVRENSPAAFRAEWQARDVALSEDLAIKYTLSPSAANRLAVLAYRENTSEPGFFEASAIAPAAESKADAPKTIAAVFDNSLSMQWEKLERSYAALDKLLRSLRPVDRFNIVLFNTSTAVFSKTAVAGTPETIEKALEFVRSSRLAGGTNLQDALTVGLAQASTQGAPADRYVVLLSDGGATRGAEIANAKLAAWYEGRRKGSSVRTYVFACGDDANMPLLRRLGDTVEWVRSTEPVEFKLNSFLWKIGRRPARDFSLRTDPAGNVSMVYPLEHSVFGGSMQWWAGRYNEPRQQRFTAASMIANVNLPASDTSHPHLPRAWAKARVDALLEKIDREGEDRATIDEIIRLARKYKFVTPYTSFLAAPRSLLRPRVIRPGDPVLRVRTDPSIVSVVAVFPFGLVKPLRLLDQSGLWQTRFLAPPTMTDGTHTVRLLLRDRQDRVFRETKTFVIASKPPTVRVRLEKTRFHRGEVVRLRASAPESARTIVARLYGTSPVNLRWNREAGSSTGDFVIPAHLAAGRYPLRVTAEDFAHNIGTEEVWIEVLP